jgi:hypothetical protein
MKRMWMFLILMIMMTGCAPAVVGLAETATPAGDPTLSPTFAVLNACEVMPERDIFLPMGEPMTILEETTANQMSSEYSFISRCVYGGSDPASEALLTLQVLQPKPGLDVAAIEVIAERYLDGMEQTGITQYETLDEFSQAAFWLPETQTMTVFMEDGTGVIVSVEPLNDSARTIAFHMIEKTLEALGY